MKVEAYFVPNPNYIPKGTYKPTALDEEKACADFLITDCGGRRTEVRFNHDVVLSGMKGRVERCESNPRIYYVTDRQLDYLKSKFTYACDF